MNRVNCIRHLILFLFFYLFGKTAFTRSFYFSVKNGNDSYTSTQAQDPSTPWKSLAKLSDFFSNIQPGDSILLNRGEIFRGSIIISASGTISSPIIISSYGTGALPVITMPAVTDWTMNTNGVYSVSKQMVPGISIFFEDGKPLVQVASSPDCTDGKWWCDSVSVYYKPDSGTIEDHILTIANIGTVGEYEAAIDLSNGSYSYITIDGIEFDAFGLGVKAFDPGNGTAGLTVQNSVFNYCQSGVFSMENTVINTNATIQNCLFYRNQNAIRIYCRPTESGLSQINGTNTACKITGNEMSETGTIDGTTAWTYGPDFEAIGVQNFMNGTISNNYIHDGFQSGIILYNLNTRSSDNNTISYNRILNNKRGALVFLGDNYIEGKSATYSFNNNFISNNLFINSVTDFDGTVAIYQGINTTQMNYFVNNTLVGDANIIYFPTSRTPYFTIENNIIYNSGSYRFINRYWSAKPANFVMDYNMYFEDTTQTSNGFILKKILPLSGMQALGLEIHSKIADPLFVDVSSTNFSLQSTSPAIDAGINVGLPYNGKAPDLGYAETNQVLPVIFTYVKAYQKNEGVQVNWSIATESNAIRYEVERSENGIVFTKVGEVAPTSNNNGSANYSWPDVNPLSGNNYYRIKVIEASGNENYSVIVNVKLAAIAAKIIAYPNPVAGKSISLQFNNLPEGKYVVNLMNNLGQRVLQQSVQHPGGTGTETIKLPASIGKGIYKLIVWKNENVSIQQIVVE